MSDPLLKHSRLPRKAIEPLVLPKLPAGEFPLDRPPEPPKRPEASMVPKANGYPSGLVKQSPQTILARYGAGETMKDIATSYGLASAEQIYRMLIKRAPDDWIAHQAARSLKQVEEAAEALGDEALTSNPLMLARRREQFKAASWLLERTNRRLYGQDYIPQTNQQPVLHITIKVNEPEPVVINHEPA